MITKFIPWANANGYDTAHTYDTERSRWVFFNPMTIDLWKCWQDCAALVAAHQRELDAQTVEELPTPLSCNPTEVQLWDVALSDCAAAIRESKP